MKKLVSIISLLMLTFQLKAQQLVGYEYFFDTDPGIGQASYVAITPSSNFNSSINVPLTNVSLGLHQLGIRFKDDQNHWSTVQTKSIIVLDGTGNTNTLEEVEVFFNQEPGIGQGMKINIPQTNEFNGTLNVQPPSGISGEQVAYVRAKNKAGLWSTYQVDTVDIQVSIFEVQKLKYKGFTVYPIPNQGLVTLKMDNQLLGNIDVEIIDVTGKRIYQSKFVKKTIQQIEQIDLRNFNSGHYFIQIIKEGENIGNAKIEILK